MSLFLKINGLACGLDGPALHGLGHKWAGLKSSFVKWDAKILAQPYYFMCLNGPAHRPRPILIALLSEQGGGSEKKEKAREDPKA